MKTVMNPKHIVYGLIFIALNILDAFITHLALLEGATEIMPLAKYYGFNLVAKGTLASLIAGALIYFERGKLLLWLDVGMMAIVVWGAIVLALLS